MELAGRPRGDELLKPGEMTALRERLRSVAARHDLTTVIACAFDHRTRMLPFLYADKRMVPAGVRAVGAALADAGFSKTRIVLEQWNPHFKPSGMQLDGRIPDLLLISSMQIHTARCKALIADAWAIEPGRRPLIMVGGPKAFYEPWDAFSADPAHPASADLAVTGEEYVLLALLEVLLSERGTGEPLREAFIRIRKSGALDRVPGLVYARTGAAGQAEELIDTGSQRLLGNLDELAHPVLGYGLLEPPSRRTELGARALRAEQVRKYSPISSLVLTQGCKFACPYCPIPAYNQRQFRSKSGARILDEMEQLNRTYGLKYFFGADDNFFNDRQRALEIIETVAASAVRCDPARSHVYWATEATVHDTLGMKDHLRLVRKAGLRALWMGVEDMSGALVKKGQHEDKTLATMRLLREHGIFPMPMLMHHDAQPLYTRTGSAGLLNQVKLLRQAGAIGLQVLMITPAPGSKLYEQTFTSGMVYQSVGGRKAEVHMFDGNYVVASRHPQPWKKQLNILTAYLYFYNPWRLFVTLVRPKSLLYFVNAGAQVLGMVGLLQSIRRTFGWALRLMTGRITHATQPPGCKIPYRRAGDSPAPVSEAETQGQSTQGGTGGGAVRMSCNG